jgi:hypothetical protein
MQADSQWEGSMKGFKGKRSKSVNAPLLITEREGSGVSGELWWDNDYGGVELAGTISDRGTVVLKVTKEPKGTKNKDLVDNARLRGTVSGKQFTARFAVPGNNARVGESKMRLKE